MKKTTCEAGEKMSLEIIKKIAAVEAETDKQRADAVSEAKKMIAQAHTEGQALLQKAQGEAEAEVRQRLDAAMAEGKAEAAKILEGVESQCDALEKGAAGKMQAAVSIIVERVVNG